VETSQGIEAITLPTGFNVRGKDDNTQPSDGDIDINPTPPTTANDYETSETSGKDGNTHPSDVDIDINPTPPTTANVYGTSETDITGNNNDIATANSELYTTVDMDSKHLPVFGITKDILDNVLNVDSTPLPSTDIGDDISTTALYGYNEQVPKTSDKLVDYFTNDEQDKMTDLMTTDNAGVRMDENDPSYINNTDMYINEQGVKDVPVHKPARYTDIVTGVNDNMGSSLDMRTVYERTTPPHLS
jgi:hypothetical protein